jgi:hypothetical protein
MRRTAILLAAATLVVGLVAAAPPQHVTARSGGRTAATTPPTANPRLLGTWLNSDPATGNVKQLVIAADGAGGIVVDAFGACTPTLCEWGRAPAVVYGGNVSSTRGSRFQVNIDHGFARSVLLGRLGKSGAGPVLRLTGYTAFTDGSGRRNYSWTDEYTRTAPATTSVDATPTVDYPMGFEPTPADGIVGTWVNTNPNTPAVVMLEITASVTGSLLVHEFGACSPSPCDNGIVPGVVYGASVSSTTGDRFIAAYEPGFKRHQLFATFRPKNGTLVVSEFSEFIDGSGRSNYEMTETFVQWSPRILVDATRDGGGWWFPQTDAFDPTAPHQGKALADAFRTRGADVVELPRGGGAITADLLARYDLVIRANGYGDYSQEELDAYLQYVAGGHDLVLLSDYLRQGERDELADALGIGLAGVSVGPNLVSLLGTHPLTQGIGDLVYLTGSCAFSYPMATTVLGRYDAATFCDLDGDRLQGPSEPAAGVAAGVFSLGKGHIFFMTDCNAIEVSPQPLADNIVNTFL